MRVNYIASNSSSFISHWFVAAWRTCHFAQNSCLPRIPLFMRLFNIGIILKAHAGDTTCRYRFPLFSETSNLSRRISLLQMFRHFTGLKQNYKILTLNVAFIRKTYCTMSDIRPNADGGVPLTDVVNALEKFAPLSLADSWDNVGLLVEPTEEKLVSHILLTNDLTEDVMEEAIDLKTDMIISYHPLIFAPMKSVTTRSWKEKIVGKCLENKIAVYCPHTTFDCVRGGVNDWLASMFEDVMFNSQPIQPNATNDDYGIGRKVTLKNQLSIEEVVERVKVLTDLEYVRLARARRTDGFVNTIALCAGSGASVLKNVPADLYLTGEMLHHDVLDAVHKGTNVILTNHSDSERGFLQNFAFTLSGMLNKLVTVHVSKKDTDPLKTV